MMERQRRESQSSADFIERDVAAAAANLKVVQLHK